MPPLHHLSATELLHRIDRGELSSREVTRYFIDRIRDVNPGLNAVVVERFAEALEQADRADQTFARGERTGRLHGLPLTIKECFDLPGTPTTLGAADQPIFLENLQDDRPIEQLADLLALARAAPWQRKLLYWLTGLLGQQSARRIIRHAGRKGAAHYERMEERQRAFAQRYLRAMDESPVGPLDAILSPMAALPAFLHRTVDKVGLGGAYGLQHNVTGFPAGVATVSTVRPEEAIGRKTTWDRQTRAAARTEAAATGLPLAVQIAARPWREDVVLALIGALHRPEVRAPAAATEPGSVKT